MTKTYTKKDQAGVPVGGTTGEVLKKNSGTDFDYDWGTGGGTPAGSDTQIQYNNSGAFGATSSFVWNDTNKSLDISSTSKDTFFTATGNINSFYQANIQNTNSGASASTDWVATANNGSSTTHYIDMGINSSGGGGAPFTTANHAYLYSIDDTLNIGALGASSQIRFFTTGGTSPVQRMVIDNAGLVGINQTTPTAKLHINTNNLGVTQADSTGILLENTQAATSVLQQYSPALTLSNFSWTTNSGGSSQSSKIRIDNAPIQKNTGTVAANFRIQQSNNGGAYSDLFSVGGTTPGGTGINIALQGGNFFNNAGGVHTFIGAASGIGFSSSGLISRATMDNNGIWAFTPASNNATSGTVSSWSHTATFAPTSGTGVWNQMVLAPTINQTGVTGTPITRALYINPIFSGGGASDFRAIDVAAGRSIFAGRVEFGKGANVTAANDLTLGAGGNVFTITGNTQINAIITAAWQAGSEITLIFTGTPTVKHNTAGGAGTAVMLLAGSVDLTAANDTVLTLVYDGTSWQEKCRKVA